MGAADITANINHITVALKAMSHFDVKLQSSTVSGVKFVGSFRWHQSCPETAPVPGIEACPIFLVYIYIRLLVTILGKLPSYPKSSSQFFHQDEHKERDERHERRS